MQSKILFSIFVPMLLLRGGEGQASPAHSVLMRDALAPSVLDRFIPIMGPVLNIDQVTTVQVKVASSTIYTGSSKKNAEHGGFSFGDTNGGLIVSNPN